MINKIIKLANMYKKDVGNVEIQKLRKKPEISCRNIENQV